MNVEELRDYCIELPGVTEQCPWTDPKYKDLVTFTVGGKWFCLLDIDHKFINIKGVPENIQYLQSHFKGALPAWHMNKKYWVSIILESDISDVKIFELVKESYNLVLNGLPVRKRP